MKKVKVVKASAVELKPFHLENFLAGFAQAKETQRTMTKVSKKALKSLASDLGLDYDDKQITFTKKLMTAYLER